MNPPRPPKHGLTSWHFARPGLALQHLKTLDLGLISATALHARRRMGKTEFLMQDLTPAAQAHGYNVGYCNLWEEEQDPAEAIAEAITACAAPGRLLAKVGFKATEKKQVARLRSAFSAFDRSRNRGLLLVDEAQVLADRRHLALEKALRALLDTRKERMKVIFTGSSEDRLRTMFSSENKAFYNWARVEPLPLLGAPFVQELTRRANALTTVPLEVADSQRAFVALKEVPELFRRFLSQYLANAFEGVDRAIENCKQSVYKEEGFASRWEKLLPADRLVLQCVAAGQMDLHGARSLSRFGKTLGLGRAASRSAPQNALKRLRNRQVLIQSQVGVYRFEDETFREWMQVERV